MIILPKNNKIAAKGGAGKNRLGQSLVKGTYWFKYIPPRGWGGVSKTFGY